MVTVVIDRLLADPKNATPQAASLVRGSDFLLFMRRWWAIALAMSYLIT
jgi:hypothetical protein